MHQSNHLGSHSGSNFTSHLAATGNQEVQNFSIKSTSLKSLQVVENYDIIRYNQATHNHYRLMEVGHSTAMNN